MMGVGNADIFFFFFLQDPNILSSQAGDGVHSAFKTIEQLTGRALWFFLNNRTGTCVYMYHNMITKRMVLQIIFI